MDDYEIWIEGFDVAGVIGPATYHGTYEAYSFDGAVRQWVRSLSISDRVTVSHNKSDCWAIGALRIFSSEDDARLAFG